MDTSNQGRASVTQSIQAYLESETTHAAGKNEVIATTQSVLEYAQELGLTLKQYVEKYPENALMHAEASLAEWLKIQTTAAVQGQVTTDQGSFTLNKNMTKLISDRVYAAERQLNMINEMVYASCLDGEKRREHLTRVLYNRAVHKGDTKALTYLIDRVDGRPGEAKTVDLDYDNAFNVYQIIHTLFDKQLQVLNSGPGTKMMCCSRRSGKTHLVSATMLIEALRVPNTTCLYIGETMEQSEILMAGAINQIIDQCALRDKRGKRLDWRHLDNGSRILVRGLSNTKDPDQIRGHKAKVIVIDEFFHLSTRHGEVLEYLIREVLRPMQMDYPQEYMFICSGTPPSVKGTYSEWCWKNWDVPHYTWTYKDNPFPADPELKEQYVLDELAEMGLDMTSPYARREYGAEWIYEQDLLLYPEVHTYDPTQAIPSINVDMVLFGLDYGVSDNDTLVGVAWDSDARKGYIFHEDKFNRLDIKDHSVSQLEYLKQQVTYAWGKALDFFPTLGDKEANKRIIWVADDNDQHVTDYFNINCRVEGKDIRLNIMNAHKTDKVFMFDKIKSLFRTASLLLPAGGKTERECQQTILKRGPGGQIYPEVDDKTFHPDLLPALRYALYVVIGNEKETR